jgi:hypothetical protein
MEHPAEPPQPALSTSERIEAYKAYVANLGDYNSRRQSVNTVFVTLNTVFLTAMGVFVSTHLTALNTLGGPIALGVIAAAITPLNLTWLATLRRYARGNQLRHDVLQKLEAGFPPDAGVDLYLRHQRERLGHNYTTYAEQVLARYFAAFYVVVFATATVLSILIQQHIIPPLALP